MELVMSVGACDFTPGFALLGCQCTSCVSVKQKLASPPQPQLAAAIQDTLKEVGRKYFSGDKASQEAGDGVNHYWYSYKENADLASDLALPVTKCWPRDVWIDDNLASLDKLVQRSNDAWAEVLRDEPADQEAVRNAYFDRIKAEAHQARMERNEAKPNLHNALRRSAVIVGSTIQVEMKASPGDMLAKAMQQPSQTDLALNEQILSARYGRG